MRNLALYTALVLSLASCAASQSVQEPTAPPYTPRSTALVLDSTAALPPYLVPAPLGSTPRQRRQWQKAQAANLARAGVLPTTVKIKHSAVATAPGAVAVTKPKASVAVGPGAVATTVTKPKGPVAAGPGSNATATTYSGISYWWLLVPLAGLLWWQRKRLALLFV
ncbi:MAG: hypothetical protein JWP58_3125 [Hymenobacter sp.]|nr:hypothetical protein [Hymenobacter sp.]